GETTKGQPGCGGGFRWRCSARGSETALEEVALGLALSSKRNVVGKVAGPSSALCPPSSAQSSSSWTTLSEDAFWYSVTRPSKKFCSFLISIISASHG